MGTPTAHNHAHPGRPLGQHGWVDEFDQLRDVTVVADPAVSIACRGRDLPRDQVDGVADLLGDGESHAVLDAVAADVALLGEPVQQALRRPGAV